MAARKSTAKQTSVETTETTVRPKKDGRIPLDTEFPCVCNAKGGLIYISKNALGRSAQWDEFGDVQYLDIRELLTMRNTQKRFFTDNWLSIKDTDDGEWTGEEAYEFLRVDEHYGTFYDADNIEKFFKLTPKQMEEQVKNMSRGMKDLLAVMAIDKIERGEIDSLKKRNDLSRILGFKMSEE